MGCWTCDHRIPFFFILTGSHRCPLMLGCFGRLQRQHRLSLLISAANLSLRPPSSHLLTRIGSCIPLQTSTRTFSSVSSAPFPSRAFSAMVTTMAPKKRSAGRTSGSSTPNSSESGDDDIDSGSPPCASTSGSVNGSPSKKKLKMDKTQSCAPREVSRLSDEHPVWPAPAATIEKAAQFIRRAAKSGEKILLVPDKDADGLSAGLIVKRTLAHLGAPAENIAEHHIPAGKNPASKSERDVYESYGARWIIVLDQGSPAGPPLVSGAEKGWDSDEEGAVRTMVLDHHFVVDLESEGPQGSLLLNACKSEPVSTSALLAWVVCRPMWGDQEDAGSAIDYLAIIGTCGDLSINVKWDAPWPNFGEEVKRIGKQKIGLAVSMINAPRRTPIHDAIVSWDALAASRTLSDILSADINPSFARLNEARRLVKDETERCTHTPPKFSKDSRVALLTIHSPYQVHPSIATRWSGTLRGAKRLQVVMCANTGFGALVHPPNGVKKEEESIVKLEEGEKEEEGERYVHFSCRIANAAKSRGEDPNIIEILQEYAAMDPTLMSDLKAAGEEQFARGHRQASGGILPASFWSRFVDIMQIGVKASPPPGGTVPKSPAKKLPEQSNKLTNYFSKGA